MSRTPTQGGNVKKWNVCLAFSASKFVGGVEAETEQEAIEKALEQEGFASLCHQCSSEITLGDPIEDDSSAEEADE
jgi:hypothetical protein